MHAITRLDALKAISASLAVLISGCEAKVEAATPRQIGSARELVKALKAARGGEVITLAPGSLGLLEFADLSFDPAVILQAKGASVSGLLMKGVSGLTINDLEIALDPGERLSGCTLTGCTSVRLNAPHVHGKPVSGITLSDCKKSAVVRGNFHELRNAIVVYGGEDIEVSGNKIRGMLSDGIVGANGPHRLLIADNDMSDFTPQAGAHPDGIQFFTRNAKRSAEDIEIRGNKIKRGKGGIPQGIFITTQNGWILPYKRVKIVGNEIEGAMHYGIGLQNAEDVAISDNTVQPIEGQKSRIHLINVTRAVAKNNKVWMITQQGANDLKISGTKTLGFLKPSAP
jgi:nitrous oxidase accessory protein NosD